MVIVVLIAVILLQNEEFPWKFLHNYYDGDDDYDGQKDDKLDAKCCC